MIYLVSLAQSQTTTWDYNRDENYKNQDFLRNSDASKWDTKKVDWNNPAVYENKGVYQRKDIYGNPQVYKNPSFYKNLPDDKYSSLDHKQVQFDKIDDHRKIDGKKVIQQMINFVERIFVISFSDFFIQLKQFV